MKTKKFLVAALATGALTFSAASSANAQVTLYEHQNYSGRSFNSSYAPNVSFMNDLASSVRVPSTRGYMFYQDAGFLGSWVYLESSYNSLSVLPFAYGLSWNDRISSFK
ncbi:MAG: peptidase inhibitor family I36 protein [Rothia sp. (in: high G+C Gram-positive bacteria)]|uniref:peptidase inhibitor family I36 protein n=1 Tax=Rothia sp. (in: high G+C Gram-positive bacteria) TaxID=1885016 RepID=UPI0026FBBBEB|nr:peptidase inhibitor family I36 protein [Rothia sp. (in: high G+C Gram-positive bacteria)]